MLGEVIGEMLGQLAGARVIPCQGRGPALEVTMREEGKLLGVSATSIGTYVAHATPAGVHRGEGEGICTTVDGDVVTWKGTGVGKSTGKGQAMSWRGAIFFSTTSPKLGRLNESCYIFEHDCDETGKTKTTLSEWR